MEEFKPGDKVRFLNEKKHSVYPEWYPPVGTVGDVVNVYSDDLLIQWPGDTTSGRGMWYAAPMFVEKVVPGGMVKE